ncbi:TetR family transcriptional regulator [Pseudomonas sp. 39004]|uniref:TetR/AcrR family transcriptional regulator n=1 Tax=Pseudomonas sp. 39004 TaxID=2967213 RepID=UPI0023632D01|nr:TetR family transcriptional regulator [Pseudomonas sp. 39004]MDD1961262.1 TetR family transcriptional regulator [Pseudomonas sp. 39004]
MVRRTQADMEQTRATLLQTARQVFSTRGYGETSMDDLTAQANLTRGALYHHFGDKKGLLAAVIEQIDAEMDARLHAISDTASNPWDGLRSRCRAYLEMAREPEIQRIVLRDGRAVLGAPTPQAQLHCVASLRGILQQLMEQGVIAQASPQALALLINGGLAEAAFWIAEAQGQHQRLEQALAAMELMLEGLRAGN